MRRSGWKLLTPIARTLPAIAHPGRTDADGGHYCRTNCAKWGLEDGEYHKHDGSSAATEKEPVKTEEPKNSTPASLKVEKLTAPTKGKLSVYYLNVGQGDATYIKTAAGDDILIDGGNNNAGDTVVAYLKQLGVDDIEVMISTHPDADHVGGLDSVFKAFKVENVYAPKVSHTTQTFKDFLNAVKAEKLTIKEAKAGVTLPLKGVTAKFVGPIKAYAASELNDWSAVLHLTYGTNTFLFTGDAESKSLSDMMKAKATLKADVLKVGHHGSNTSTSAAFLKVVSPKYAVISVGKNSYGHPTKSVLDALKAAKATIYRTDLNGTVTAVSDGKMITIKKVK
ncbi:MBL fold metallo-hydrolase [Paenibacillus mendelii]|uniref:MBL fold metallo-hydrolase n=1 Tax=Paenibacillus mendelii TaxID=206163 RepID=A0ABV6JDK3_9BACL